MITVDSHCHLDMLKEYDTIDNIINRATKNNVSYIQTICTKLDDLQNILPIIEKYHGVFASVGVHPSEVKIITEFEKLLTLADHKKLISFGETGLDYFYNTKTEHQALQRESFQQHILASQNSNLPVIIHTRSADDDTLSIIRNNQKNLEFSGVIHCFTGSKSFAKQMLNLGMYISISGIVTFKKSTELQEVIKFIPLDRMLIETDSPYLSPVPKRGRVNEPSYIKYILEFISDVKKTSIDQVAKQTTSNFFNLFSKAKLIENY